MPLRLLAGFVWLGVGGNFARMCESLSGLRLYLSLFLIALLARWEMGGLVVQLLVVKLRLLR